MINSENILNSFTKKLSANFDSDIFVDNSEGSFDKECFYVTLIPLPIKSISNNTNEKTLIISIKYFNNDRLKIYNISDKLSQIFTRTIKVNDDYINISNVEPNILKDEIGNMLDFLVTCYYHEHINSESNSGNYEDMEQVNIKFE